LSPAQKADTKAVYNIDCAYKDTENNIRRAVNAVLNRVVPNTYKITSIMTMLEQGRNYPTNNDPHTTLDTLRV
jgi:uncharacterized lipoprotein YajG